MSLWSPIWGYDKDKIKKEEEKKRNAKLNKFSKKSEFEKEEEIDFDFLSDMKIEKKKVNKEEISKKLDDMLKNL